MSETINNQSSSSCDGRVSQLEREHVSGRHSALGATNAIHRPHSSNPRVDNNVAVSQRRNTSKQYVAEDADYACPPTQRPPSACGERPPTAPGRRRRAVRHNVTDSYVDESLFGPVVDCTFTVSRQPKQRPVKPFIFDCTDYKAKATNSNSSNSVPSSRPSSQRSAKSRPRSARLHSQPSFVDESLFGDQLELSMWRAPWDKKDCRPKPLIFDATNYREKQQRTGNSETQHQRASSANRASRKQPPPWR